MCTFNIGTLLMSSLYQFMSRNICLFFSLFVFFSVASCKGQQGDNNAKNSARKIEKALPASMSNAPEARLPIDPDAPNAITRNIIQDKDGQIWFATFEGVIKYDGSDFVNMTKDISSNRFFSLFEDRHGMIWLGSIGDGIYRYDGKTFHHFTSKDGLASNAIVSIYEDDMGQLWFGGNWRYSRYDRETFHNYSIVDGAIVVDQSGALLEATHGEQLSNGEYNEFNAIIQDRSGKIWLATRGSSYILDGNTFTKVMHNNIPFGNVRSMIESSNGDIWLGGSSGLWRYRNNEWLEVSEAFVGYIYEDKTGNIWTSGQDDINSGWTLSRFDMMFLNQKVPLATKIKTGEGMFFGILEDKEGSIWAGTLDGVYRYRNENFEDFKKDEN